uniref:Chromosome partition protein n=1 Tax=Siphoviridae sp. ctYh54 TaxID=2826379 RepID=A0A8S5ME05_9CAUD|nr:MAG TPA: chromosome partition protein [Siphoviridae sp. ctYh54]
MSVLEEVDRAIQTYDNIKRDLDYMNTKIYDCDANIAVLLKKKETILSAKTYYKKAIDILYQNSIKELESLINDVVSAVFYDRNLVVRMELTDSRSKSLLWYVIDEDKGIQMSVKNGVGRGIRTVLSFIIQSYYLLSLGSKYMFIDEGYSYISEAYVGKFFEFVNLLCEEKGLSLVMISHDERFSGYADYSYGVINGKIQEWVRNPEKGEMNESLCTENK